MVSVKFALIAAIAATPAVFAYESYMAKIPNGVTMGKSLGHAGDKYTPFGDLYKANGGNWAVICKQKWPGASVSVGAALGDPCCKFTGGAAQIALSAPDTNAKECDAGAGAPSAAPSAAPAPAPAAPASPAAQGPATPAPASGATPAPGAPASGATPAPAAPGKVVPPAIPAPVPGSSGNSTKPMPTPAASKGGKPHKLCH